MFKVEHLKTLQRKLKEDGLSAYLILTGDSHASEYAADYFLAERKYFCPFTGSAGQVLVTQDKAYLFTDGRYFIQAAKQLKGSGISLMKMGAKGVPSLEDFIKQEKLYPLGVNYSMISQKTYEKLLNKKTGLVDADYNNLVEGRPELPLDKIWKLDKNLYTLDYKEKISDILKEVEQKGAEANLVTTLDDIAWILNLRGSDIPSSPVFYSYLYLSKKYGNHLFIDLKKIDFKIDQVEIHPYSEVVIFVKAHKDVETIVDENRVSARLFTNLSKPVAGRNPSYLMKSIKGKVEIENTKKVQIIDGLALLKFSAFLDENINNNLTEFDYSEQLEKYRRENKLLFDLSFGTIAACGPNAAQMHYAPTKQINTVVTPDQMELLVDSGGHYYGGTTDTTRTFSLGKLSDEYKHDYTLTLKSVIAVSTAVFMDGSSGVTLDYQARKFMWNEGMDYKCGTGHGVGYMLNVHEGPNGLRYRVVPERDDANKLLPGMITTIEPGVYKEGKYGIRIENNLVCVPAFETDMGVFYKHETMTCVPIDTKPLDLTIMTDQEIEWLNNYHQFVYDNLAPLCDEKLLEVLKNKTAKISR